MFTRPSSATTSPLSSESAPGKPGSGPRRFVAALLIVASVLSFGYFTLSCYIATQLIYTAPIPLYSTPASLGLQYRDVTFFSREDHVQLRGWFIPGVLPNGQLTAQRTIIVVHGYPSNRADPSVGLLDLSGDFARRGFAVLAFDLRGMGESSPAPLSLGYFEQRDVLGAVDFLHSGTLPYPELGRPRAIAGWGVSMGGATLLLAAAREPAIRAVVSDCAYADIIPILEREIPKRGNIPPAFTPGALWAAQAIYGMDFFAVRPVDVVAQIAPRPLLFIHGDADTYIPPYNMTELADAAHKGRGAQVQTWLVHGATHARSFKVLGQRYVERVTAFYAAALASDSGTR